MKRGHGMMKRLIAVCALTFAATMPMMADTWTDPDTGYTWTYRINGDTAEIYKGDYSPAIEPLPIGPITIPSVLGGKLVTSIGEYAFRVCDKLTSVSIPSSITNIGMSAFAYCNGLINVIIPDEVTDIGCRAFYDCKGLTNVTISCRIANIEREVFSGCSGMMSVTIPNNVTNIGFSAFAGCCKITSVMIPDRVRNIGASAFSGCTGITSIVFSSRGGLAIGNGAFSGCSALGAVMVTDLMAWYEIEFADESANPLTFAHSLYTTRLVKELNVPEHVGRIRNYAFNGCSSLMKISIPNSVTNIGEGAFSNCSGLISVTIPNSVTSVEQGAFSRCSGLKNVTIGNGVTNIGGWVFSDCSNLTSVTIPNSVTNIGAGVFYECSSLTRASIGDSVTSIRFQTFYGCSSMTDLSIGNNVTNIENQAFACCSTLMSVTIPDSVVNIGNQAFYFCGLTSATIGNGVTSIGYRAFAGCSRLMNVLIGYSVQNIGVSAFESCRKLTSVTLPDSVTNIENSAFVDCRGLKGVIIPRSITSIAASTFYSCSNLKWVVVPDSVTSIGDSAFLSCSSLEAVYLLGSTPPTTGARIYNKTSTSLTTYVPEGSTGWLFPNMSVLPEKWPTGDDNNERAIEFGSPVLVDITLDANGGEVTGGRQMATRLAGFELDTFPEAVREGYVFLGWFTGREAGDKVMTNTIVTAEMTTLYAHWGDKPEIETGGNADWTQETDGSWRSGVIGGSETTWMETTVYGEGEISFRWKVSSYSYYAKLYFYVDGVQMDCIGGEVGWTDKTFVISGKGAHTLRWAYSKTSSYTSGSDCGWVDAVAWTPYVECTVTFDANGGSLGGAVATRSVYKGQAIGELPLPTKDGFIFAGWWSAGGERVTAETVVAGMLPLTARWEVNPFAVGAGANWAQDGDGSWKSGVTAHNATNSISMSVSGAGTIAFDWKVSCEGFYRTYRLDYLAFFIDGVEQGFINGVTDWTAATFDVTGKGSHTLTWSYIKDSEGVAGSDCAWLRSVTWTPSAEEGLTAWLSERNLTADARAANGRTAAECYALGLDPALATDDFRIVSIEMVDGEPKVEWEPKVNRWTGAEIQAVLEGAATLGGEWKAVEGATAEEKAAMRFFKVVVEVP